MTIDVAPIRGIGITDTYFPINWDNKGKPSRVHTEENMARMKIDAILVCEDGQRFIFDSVDEAECFDDKRAKSLKALRAVGYVPV